MKDFETIFVEMEPMIERALNKCNVYRHVEEYRQTARIAVWEAWQTYDETKGEFEPYAYMKVRFAVLQEMTKMNREGERSVVVEEDTFIHLCVASDFVESFCLKEALALLNDEERAVIYYSFYMGMTLEEIACSFNKTMEGVKKRRQRALKKLREFSMK